MDITPARIKFCWVEVLKRSLTLVIIIATSMLTPVPMTVIAAQEMPPLKGSIKRQERRNEYTKFEAVIDGLGITPGMTVLDVGSGPGYASFLFAEKLRGSGHVFATDIRPEVVRYVTDEAKRRGLTNLTSAVVAEKGFDNFYSRHQYDVVFLSNVYHCLDSRIDYFRRLRSHLRPNARLVLILYNQTPLFTVDDLSDVDEIATMLSRESSDSPFIKSLSPATLLLLWEDPKGEALEKALVDDFNRMLTDPLFYKSFYKDSFFTKGLFTPPERDFANWLLMTLHEDGVFEKRADKTDERTLRNVIKLNRMFFMKKFGELLENTGSGAYIPKGDANRHTSKYVMFRELDAAGYKITKELRLSAFFDAVIMTTKTQ